MVGLGGFSGRAWIGLSLVFVAALASITLLAIWLTAEEVWIEKPAMLRILEGEVEVSGAVGSAPGPAADMTWLNSGSRLRAKQGSRAIVQFFDGSVAEIRGPAEVHLSRSQGLEGRPPGGPRSIGLEVLNGKATFSVAGQSSTHSLFNVRTPSSVGQVQSALLEVDVREGGGAIWEMSRGTAWIGVMTADRDWAAAVALIRLNARDGAAAPALPEEWREEQSIVETFVAAAEDIVRESARAGTPDVRVDGTSLVALGLGRGSAVFRVSGVVRPATAIAAGPQLPPDYESTRDPTLEANVPGLVVASTQVLRSPFIPVLPTPESWVAAETARRKPPQHFFSIVGVAKPLGVAVDPAGQRICVTETSGERVTRVFDREGSEIMVLAPPGTTAAERSPFYVAIDRMGSVYVSDRLRHTVDMYDVDGTHLGPFVPRGNSSPLQAPLGLGLDSAGNLYVTEVSDPRHGVLVFAPSGELKLELGRDSGAGLSFPNDIAVDGRGRVYVADSNNFRIQVFDARGQPLASLSGALVGFPRGIEIGGRYLYAVDALGHTIHVFDVEEGLKLAFSFGERGGGTGQFNFPNGLDLDSTMRLYVADRENDRVQIWGY
jgi:sugar lactone lactonase YvrE